MPGRAGPGGGAPAKADVIETAGWVLDLGPEGGVKGGEVVAERTPEVGAACAASFTGRYLVPLLKGRGEVRAEAAEECSTLISSLNALFR